MWLQRTTILYLTNLKEPFFHILKEKNWLIQTVIPGNWSESSVWLIICLFISHFLLNFMWKVVLIFVFGKHLSQWRPKHPKKNLNFKTQTTHLQKKLFEYNIFLKTSQILKNCRLSLRHYKKQGLESIEMIPPISPKYKVNLKLNGK